MELLKKLKSASNQRDVNIGEEKLTNTYEIEVEDKSVHLIFGIDGGSTSTRALAIDGVSEDDESEVGDITNPYTKYVIPSSWGTADMDKYISSKSSILYDNLDSKIRFLDSKESVVGNVRVIRGMKLRTNDLNEMKMTNSLLKSEDQTFYVNIIDSIGYTLVQKYNGKVPSVANVHCYVALPPNEAKGNIITNNFKEELKGRYQWELLGNTITINIVDVGVSTETESFIQAYQVEHDIDMSEIQYALHYECGGRNVGIELLQQGQTYEGFANTFNYGGSRLAQDLGNEFVNEYGGKVPTMDLLRKALITGNLKWGKFNGSVVDLIKRVKNKMADDMITDTKDLFSAFPKVDISSVEMVTYSGGMMRRGDYGVSVADYLTEKLSKLVNVEDSTMLIDDNYIPQGLLMLAYDEYEDCLNDNFEDEVEE